jgi:hypothetical protein
VLNLAILEETIYATGHERKYAIRLLNSAETTTAPRKRHASHKYDEQVKQALISLWCAANQICSKRIAPFLPQLIEAMERHGHLRLPSDVRARLMTISAAAIDRLLSHERGNIRSSVSTTKRGNLLKHQIQIRTFADWDDVTPGFFGYDRFEGYDAWVAFAKLYKVLRMYVNFFQPSLKLLKKERIGAKVSKNTIAQKRRFNVFYFLSTSVIKRKSGLPYNMDRSTLLPSCLNCKSYKTNCGDMRGKKAPKSTRD